VLLVLMPSSLSVGFALGWGDGVLVGRWLAPSIMPDAELGAGMLGISSLLAALAWLATTCSAAVGGARGATVGGAMIEVGVLAVGFALCWRSNQLIPNSAITINVAAIPSRHASCTFRRRCDSCCKIGSSGSFICRFHLFIKICKVKRSLGSVDVSFTAAFGPVLGLNKENIATWYEYHQRFLTPFRPKNGLNPKG
jgi:hypothetical protein